MATTNSNAPVNTDPTTDKKKTDKGVTCKKGNTDMTTATNKRSAAGKEVKAPMRTQPAREVRQKIPPHWWSYGEIKRKLDRMSLKDEKILNERFVRDPILTPETRHNLIMYNNIPSAIIDAFWKNKWRLQTQANEKHAERMGK